MKPPGLARWLLRRVLPHDYRAPVVADLDDDFQCETALNRSALNLRSWYWRQALTSLPGAARLRLREWRFVMLTDIRFAVRRLGRSPAFTLFAVVTLALGIGATTTVFAIVRSVTAPPSGVHEPEQIVNVYHAPIGAGALSWPDFQDLQARQTTFSALMGWRHFGPALSANGRAERRSGEIVTGTYFSVLGVTPHIGRLLQPDDDRPGAAAVVVISYGLWRRMFDGSPDALGAILRVAGEPHQVIGVTPQTFRGVSNSGITPSAVWVTPAILPKLSGTSYSDDPNNRESRWIFAKGRLKSGRTMAEVASELAAIGGQLDREHPIGQDIPPRYRTRYNTTRVWHARALTDVRINESDADIVDRLVAALVIAVTLVLMVACTNLANLMLARASNRRHEFGVRRALGGSRWALVRGTLLESGMLAAAGGAGGLVVARVLTLAISREVPIVGTTATMQVGTAIDPIVVLMAGGTTLVALFVAGVVPALQSTCVDVRQVLASEGISTAAPRWRGRRLLIAAQVLVSTILMAVAALTIGQLRAQQAVEPGFELQRLAVAQVDFVAQGYGGDRARLIADAILREMSQRRGSAYVAAMSGLPIGLTTTAGVRLPGVQLPEGTRGLVATLVAGTSRTLPTLGVPVRHGRPFDDRDTAASEPVVVVGEAVAKALFGAADATGREIEVIAPGFGREGTSGPSILTIVGVAADIDAGSRTPYNVGVVYLPLAQHFNGRLLFVANADRDPRTVVPDLRSAIRSVDPELAIAEIGTGPEVTGFYTLFYQVVASIAGVLGILAWTLSLAGLFGVLSHLVTRRRRELALRMALGADVRTIVRMVVREGLSPVTLGLAGGLGLGALLRLAIQPFLVRALPAVDLAVLVTVPLLFIGAGFVACYFPARLASRVAPMQVLKD